MEKMISWITIPLKSLQDFYDAIGIKEEVTLYDVVRNT